MGSIIGSCIGSAVCSACCAGCGSCTPETDHFGKISRIPYLFLVILSGLFAVFMSLYGEQELDLTFYSTTLCSDACEGNGSVFRVSFCLFIFEAIHVLIVPFVNDFHWVWFPIKFMLYAAGMCAAFLISGSNTFFNNFADYFARYMSIVYLLIQILILIDWAWSINEWSLKKSGEYVDSLNLEEEDRINNYNCCKNPFDVSRATISITLYIGSFILIGFFFDWYGGNGCSTHEALIAVTIIILVINFVGSGIAGGGTFPVAAILSTYAMFLLYAALSAQPSCNKYYNSSSTSMYLGIAFVLLALCYSAMKADLLGSAVDMTGVSCCGLCPGYTDPDSENGPLLANSVNNDSSYNENAGLGASNYDDAASKNDLKREGNDSNIGAAANASDSKDVALNVGNNENDSENKENNKNEDDDESKLTVKQKKQNTIYFHFILMLAACYMAMLFTDWGDSSGGITTTGKISAWANIGCQYVSMLLFWQSLFIFYKESRTIEE